MDQAINTVDDMDKLVYGIYDSFKSSALYSGNLTILPDLQADFVYCVKGYSNAYGDIYRWKDIKATNTDIKAVYADLYDVINRCNFLLDNVEKVKAATNDDKQLDKLEQYEGEAYFARALAYSELIKCFCKAYDSDEQAEQAHHEGVGSERHLLVVALGEQAEDHTEPEVSDDEPHHPEAELPGQHSDGAAAIEGDESDEGVAEHSGDRAEAEVERERDVFPAPRVLAERCTGSQGDLEDGQHAEHRGEREDQDRRHHCSFPNFEAR